MIPIHPLDGGRITQVVGSWFKPFGFLFLLAFTAWLKDPGLLLIWILVLSDLPWKPRLISRLGIACQVLMLTMWIGQIGLADPFWAMVIDTILATAFNWMFLYRAAEYNATVKQGRIPVIETSDSRPEASQIVRRAWLYRYAVLCIGLYLLMEAHIPLIMALIKNP